MWKWQVLLAVVLVMMIPDKESFSQEQSGSIRGIVYDKEFDLPLTGALITIVETGQKTNTTDQGNFVFTHVLAGRYTLIISKEGYARQVRANVLVSPNELTDVEAALSGEFTEMEEFVVQDILPLGGSTEESLLKLRFESAALMDSISSDLMSRAGVGDAASALKLVSGASIQDGKFAVIRGLPDRYVSSQMNGVRLPTADEDKRAVQLDQFSTSVMESIQVSKTFTPDQQGDASGGAVNLRLKSIPEEPILQFSFQTSHNSEVRDRDDFVTYHGGKRDAQINNLGQDWVGEVGVFDGKAPSEYKWTMTGGGKHQFDNGIKIGGLASVLYERDVSYFDDGVDDKKWVYQPGQPMSPQTFQGDVSLLNFKTSLLDRKETHIEETRSELLIAGAETENHSLSVVYFHTNSTEDRADLSIDTRGKEYFFPGHDPNDPNSPGNSTTNQNAAPYLRLETLELTERRTGTFQVNGRHRFPTENHGIDHFLLFRSPELDWTASRNYADLGQPDKRLFGALWWADSPSGNATWFPYKSAENFNLGNLQRIFKEISEQNQQYAMNLKLPFEQWSELEGYLKFGLFRDNLSRKFNQDTFSNFGDNTSFEGDFNHPWSDVFPTENTHPISDGPPFVDVDYRGDQDLDSWYSMLDLPLYSWLNLIGGFRVESTKIKIVNLPEEDATWYPEGSSTGVALNPGDADVSFAERETLPSLGFILSPTETIRIHGSYSQTIARQTFKELTPILQQEYLGGDIFIGNPDLGIAELKNYDIRLDYTPYPGSLLSFSWFKKFVKDPIEQVQRISTFTYETAVNYPRGEMKGFEIEARQDLGHYWESLNGLSFGANATFLDSNVTLPEDEARGFNDFNIQAPMNTRDMTDAPEHLYNFFVNYDAPTNTQFSLFYTVHGDTLIAGAGEANERFVPNVYEREFGRLNISVAQKLGKFLKLQVQGKNLTNPRIEEVYRSPYAGGDSIKRSYERGIDYSISLGVEIAF